MSDTISLRLTKEEFNIVQTAVDYLCRGLHDRVRVMSDTHKDKPTTEQSLKDTNNLWKKLYTINGETG